MAEEAVTGRLDLTLLSPHPLTPSAPTLNQNLQHVSNRWNLRLKGCDFTVVHTKQSLDPSDFLSDIQICLSQEKVMAAYIHAIIT